MSAHQVGMNISREPTGIPTGGQFATGARAEAELDLTEAPDRDQRAHDAVMAYLRGEDVDLPTELEESYPNVSTEVIRKDITSRLLTMNGSSTSVFRARELLLDLEAHAQDEDRWREQGFEPGEVSTGESGRDRIGSRYDRDRDIVETKKAILVDLKEARDAGFLPSKVTFSATSSRFRGGSAVHVTIKGLDDREIYAPQDISRLSMGRVRTARTQQAVDRVGDLIAVHNMDMSRTETDYFHVGFYATVGVEDDRARAEADKLKLRKRLGH